MQLYDLHTHTTMSDGHVRLDDLVKWEQNMGRVLGVSDHVFCAGLYTEKDIAAYLDMLSAYPVYRGMEANMEQNFSLPDALDERVDYVIASVHSMPDGRGGFIPLNSYFGKRAGYTANYKKNYSSDMNHRYLAYVLRLIEKAFSSQRVDILGHATVLPCWDELFGTKFLVDWENAVLSLCARYGVALEISGMWHAPHESMLKRAKAMGLKFSLGSDCHDANSVGVLDYCERMIDTIGLTEEDFFVPNRTL